MLVPDIGEHLAIARCIAMAQPSREAHHAVGTRACLMNRGPQRQRSASDSEEAAIHQADPRSRSRTPG